jgi:hypothetical protein
MERDERSKGGKLGESEGRSSRLERDRSLAAHYCHGRQLHTVYSLQRTSQRATGRQESAFFPPHFPQFLSDGSPRPAHFVQGHWMTVRLSLTCQRGQRVDRDASWVTVPSSSTLHPLLLSHLLCSASLSQGCRTTRFPLLSPSSPTPTRPSSPTSLAPSWYVFPPPPAREMTNRSFCSPLNACRSSTTPSTTLPTSPTSTRCVSPLLVDEFPNRIEQLR